VPKFSFVGLYRKGERKTSLLGTEGQADPGSLRFVPLPKSATPSRIRTNIQIYDFELIPEDMARIDALDKPGREGCLTWNPVDVP